MPQTTTWIGQVAAIAEVNTFTPGGSITTGDVNHLTVTNQDGTTYVINFTTGGTTTAAAVSAGLIAAWNANINAAALATPSGSATVILTAKVAGQPLNVASTVTGTGTLTKATTTANAGPSDWSIAGNWSTGVAPGNGDTVYLNGQALASIYYGLNQSATALTIYRTADFVEQLGQQNYGLNPGNNSFVYDGQVPAGVNVGLGSSRIKYACGAGIVTFFIFSGSNQVPADSGQAVLQISGGAAGTKIYIVGVPSQPVSNSAGTNVTSSTPPTVNIGMSGGDVGTIDTVDVGSGANNGYISIGAGIALGSFQAAAGTCVLNTGVSGVFNVAGSASVTVQGQGTIGTATIGGYTAFNNRNTGSAIITTLNVLPQAMADFSQNPAPGTVTTLNQYASQTQSSSVKTFAANPGHITFGTRSFVDGGTITLST